MHIVYLSTMRHGGKIGSCRTHKAKRNGSTFGAISCVALYSRSMMRSIWTLRSVTLRTGVSWRKRRDANMYETIKEYHAVRREARQGLLKGLLNGALITGTLLLTAALAWVTWKAIVTLF